MEYAEDRSDPNYRGMRKEQIGGETGYFGLDVAADLKTRKSETDCLYIMPCT